MYGLVSVWWLIAAIFRRVDSFPQLMKEDSLKESLTSLVKELIPELPSCLVVVNSSPEPMFDLPEGVLSIRTTANSTSALMETLGASFRMKCSGYIVAAEDALLMLDTFRVARLQAEARHTPKIVVLPSTGYTVNNSCHIFKHYEATYIPDILVISKLDDNEEGTEGHFLLLTNRFVGNEKDNCAILAEWPSHINEFFPDKIKDLQGKELRVATLDYPPYTILSPHFDGMEGRIARQFCEIYNCSVSTVVDRDLWGEIFDNGTGIGVSGNVYMDNADFGMAAVYAWEEEHKYVDYTFPYLNTKVTVLVPKPELLPNWRIPLLPFSTMMWGFQVFSIIGSATVLFLVNKLVSTLMIDGHKGKLGGEFASYGGILLRALAMSVLQPPPNRIPDWSPLRKFFTIFEVLFLFFTTIYSGALSSVLTVPLYYPPIDTPLALYESQLPWAADHDAWTYSIKGATEPHMRGLVSRFEAHPTEKLIEMSKRGGYGFSIEIMATGHVTQTKHLSGEMILGLHVMKRELYTTSLVSLIRKGSPYTDKLNKLLAKCLDYGLLLMWETEVTLNYLSSRLQTALKISEGIKHDALEPTQLKVEHVQGVFIMLGLGLIISIIVFIFEVRDGGKKKMNKQNVS